ncbi:hypothetical protein ABTE74_20085, partial [Acinetobacter baumannii]
VVQEEALQECATRAKNDFSRIGEALVIAGHIDAQCLQSTLLAQELCASGAISQKTAMKLIASTSRNRIPLVRITESSLPTGSLTTLLVDA